MFAEKSISKLVFLHLIAILFVITNVSDIEIAEISKVIPLFDLMIIFYFAVFRHVFALWFIFLLGVWNDALNGTPIGVTPLCYIFLIKFFILLNRRLMIKEEFLQLWQQFVAFCFCFIVLKWMMLRMIGEGNYNFISFFVQFILTVSFYVLMHKVFDYLNHKLIEER